MNRNEIQSLLHHRDPYLMIDRVDQMNEENIDAVKVHSGNEFYVKGHFPNAPVVPGAMIQEMCTQAAGILITKHHSPVENYDSEKTKGWALGVLRKVNYAKFKSITKADSDININVKLIENVDNLFTFKATVKQSNETKAQISFNLANISDDHLTN